jgi:signal transduction histidine kinase/phosphatidylserine/phosphatidylglycerophosphate/cardiolipin synthase-like enzyme
MSGAYTMLYVPCETGHVRVKLGFGDTLSPLEETALQVIGSAGHVGDDMPPQPVDVRALGQRMGLGHRVVLDLVHDLWRAGHLVLDFASGTIALSPSVRELWQAKRLTELSGVETEERTVELMIEGLTGYVMPGRGPRAPGEPETAVRSLDTDRTLADAAQADLHDAVRSWLRQMGRTDQPDDAVESPVELSLTGTWARERRILSIRTPTADRRGGGQRWIRLQVQSAYDEASDRLLITVADNRFPAGRREQASDLLTRLAEENPREPFVIRLRSAAEQNLAEPPGLEDLIDRLASDAAKCATTVAGQRRNEHNNLAADAGQIDAMLAARFAREVDIDPVVGAAEHTAALEHLIEHAEKQLVIVCPFITYPALDALIPSLQQAIQKGVQVVIVWGIGHKYALRDNVANALDSLTRLSRSAPLLRPQIPARTHAKLVIRDDCEALITSRNMLSAGHARNEVGVLLRTRDGAVDKAVRDLLGWVCTNVPGDISRSVLYRPEHFGQPTVPAAPTRADRRRPEPASEDDEHPGAVQAWSLAWQAYADGLASELAGRDRPSVRLVADGTHREVLWHALRRARRRLVITSGRLSDEVVDGRMTEALKRLLDHGVAVTIGYDEQGSADRFEGAFAALSALAAAYPGLCRLHVSSGHAKVLVWDDEVVVGSFNYLSQGGYGEHGGRHLNSTELSVRVKHWALADQLAAACGEPEEITRQVSGTAAGTAIHVAPQPRDSAVPRALQQILGASGDVPVDALVQTALVDVPDPWPVLEMLPEGPVSRAAAAYCLAERAEGAEPAVVARGRQRLIGELWQAGYFMEAAVLRAAEPDETFTPRQAVAAAVAGRGLPGGADALLAAVGGDLAADEAASLLIVADAETLASQDESAMLACTELAPQVGGAWAELAGLAITFAENTAGVSITELMGSAAFERQLGIGLTGAWERLEVKLLEAQPLPANIDGARKTHAALFKDSGLFGRLDDMARRRDIVALARLVEAEFPARYRLDEVVGEVLDRTWRQAAPRTELLLGRPRIMYVRRLVEVVAAARDLLTLAAAGDRPPVEHHPDLIAAATVLADEYGRLRDGLTATGMLDAPLASSVRAEIDALLAGDVPTPHVGPPVELQDGMVGILAAWPGRWRYPRLAAQLHAAGTVLSESAVATLLLADLTVGQLTPQAAARSLIAVGEFGAAEALRTQLVPPPSVAEAMRDELEAARAAAVARIEYEASALLRRSRRAGGSPISVSDVAARAAQRLADAEAMLAELETQVRDAEVARAAQMRMAAENRLGQLEREVGRDARRAAEGWLSSVHACIAAREFEAAQNLLDSPDPTDPPPPGPRTVPHIPDVWPYDQTSRDEVLTWYFEPGSDVPLGFDRWRPPLDDSAAWDVLSALRAFSGASAAKEVTSLCAGLRRLIGGDHSPFPVERSGRGHRTRIWLPDYGQLPDLPILGRVGVATWVAGHEDPPPVLEEPILWLITDFGSPRNVPRGTVVVDLPFLFRLVAPLDGRAPSTIIRLVNLLRRIGLHLGPGPLLADVHGAIAESQVVWLLHLLDASADGVVAEAIYYDCGGRLEVLGAMLEALCAGEEWRAGLDVAALNRIRNDDTWREAATARLLRPLANDLPATLALRTAAAFYEAEFSLEDLRDGITVAADEAHGRLVTTHTDLALALARLVRAGLLDSPAADLFRLPANGLRDLLARDRPGHRTLDLAKAAIAAEYLYLQDSTARRRAEISERVVRLIGHHIAVRLAAARSAIDLKDLERASSAIEMIGSISEMYRAATEPNRQLRVKELLDECLHDIEFTHPDVECVIDGDPDLTVMANEWILGQAFHNLFDNGRRAIQATGREFGKLRVTVVASESDSIGACCCIDIEDDGIGFSARARSQITDGDRVSVWGGRGIGIRTAREWIVDYGGSLEILHSNSPLGGAHLRVLLPLLTVDAAKVAMADSETINATD